MLEVSSQHPTQSPLSTAQKNQFSDDLARLRDQVNASTRIEDFEHLKKIERWGRICTAIGYGTAWIIPNPVSAFFINLGILNRWANVNHPISHGGYDKIAGVPPRYTSKHFAQGWRRFVDWFDWIVPAGWHQEHNQLHHYRLGETADPDLVEDNLSWLRDSKLPMSLRYVVVFLFACVWKPVYYAQATLKELRILKAKKTPGVTVVSSVSLQAWSPFYKEGREYWFQCIIPYAAIRFIVIPGLFFPLGMQAVISVLLTSLLAEVFANLHSFLVIVPNHTGDDITRFKSPIKNKQEFYYRQVVGSVNYKTGSDLNDFFHGWLNYQIEHHLWPALPLSQYQQLQPEVKALCIKHGIEYKQESVFKRLVKTVDIMIGKTSMRWDDEERLQQAA